MFQIYEIFFSRKKNILHRFLKLPQYNEKNGLLIGCSNSRGVSWLLKAAELQEIPKIYYKKHKNGCNFKL